MRNLNIKNETITLTIALLSSAGLVLNSAIPRNVFTSPFIHADHNHYIGNILLFLILSPNVEEKFGKLFYILSFVLTVTPIYYFHTAILNTQPIGLSAWIFALICMNTGNLKISGIILVTIYSINEISGFFSQDNVSHIGHLLGILSGITLTLLYNKFHTFSKRKT